MCKKSAGIITLYASQNFGAFLQGFAMQTTLQKLGYDTEFIKYSRLDIHEFLFMIKTKNIKLIYFRLCQFKKYIESRNMLNIAFKKYAGEHKDAVIVGSDTLWDVQNPTIKSSTYYLGKGLNSENIVAYAPSANSTTAKDFFEHYGEGNLFFEFKAIGVRDENTANLVAEISGEIPEVVLDPTFLLNKENYPVVNPKVKEKYILVYGYSFNQEEQQAIKKYARLIGAKIISVGLLNTWCDKNVTATVSEFLGYIESSECVFTSTFHGTIFSVIMEKNFVTYARSNYKILDLLNKFKLNSRNGSNDVKNSMDILKAVPDYTKVKNSIADLRSKSLKFLKDNLN